ncbi:MAG: ribosome small subunit-dependent GTPase A [Lachnospiraceae bacterium]|jgi:ribosome biogenesis GTPase|nr:ribosome small subunit-dependent GTPase A [Lachnospiraceae bacterium]MDY6333180.1 ribosome small subunit-dependent GTPase A [Lachnospiraceae bacterium]
MPSGKIIKSLSGFYEVHTGRAVYRCRAKGVFRSLGVKPLVGDDVEFDVIAESAEPKEGTITRILPRKNELIRPSVANIDQSLLVFAITHPAPSYQMLDRFLISMQERKLPAILCFSKADLAPEAEKEELRGIYGRCGCQILFLSTEEGSGLDAIRRVLRGKTTVFAGPSGVGKSTLINLLCPEAEAETGELSRKIQRGKNTTRHVELFRVDEEDGTGTFVMDTPGFTSLDVMAGQAEELKDYYPEFVPYLGKCRFDGCNHMEEPGCAVRQAVQEGQIPVARYENYRALFLELKDRKPVYRKERNGRG